MKKISKFLGAVTILLLLSVSLSLITTAAERKASSDTLFASKTAIQITNPQKDGPLKHTNHLWSFTWDGRNINAKCKVYTCDGTSTLKLRDDVIYSTDKKVFYYCSGKSIDTSAFVEASSSWDAEYSFAYAPMDDLSGEWKVGTPTEEGTYKLTLRMPEGVEVTDSSGDYLNPKYYVCVEISSTHIFNDNWTTSGKKICNCCMACGTSLAEFSIDESTAFGNACSEMKHVPNLITWYLDDSFEKLANQNYPQTGYVFEGKTRAMKKKYPLQTQIPGEVGVYNLYFALFEGDFTIENLTAKTDPIDYVVNPHFWEYSADGYKIYADCDVCDAHGEVCLNTSTVYQASRSFSGSEIQDYDVFYETDWSNQEGIAQYSVLFSGKETGSNTLYDRAFSKPITAGNYDVRLAILSDEDDPESAIVSTKEKPFYLADISVAECEVITYGNTEIAQFPEPVKKNGYYQVGTREELMWCLYKANATANIELTNDIVVNPITVDDNGNVYSANYQIYLWDGFGTPDKPYTGSIHGNGYTVYGLYMPNASNKYSAFIDYGKNCEVCDLIIENSVLYGVDAAAIIGRYDIRISGVSITVSGCHTLNCYISGSSTQGGIISWINSDRGTELHITYCGCDSIVYGSSIRGAGGIVGKGEGIDGLFIEDCYNLGRITSTGGMAGGIIGYGNLDGSEAKLVLQQDYNTGDIKGSEYEGGIAGYLKDSGSNKLYFNRCTSIGFLGTSKNMGGIAGYINSKSIGYYYANYPAYPNYYYNARIAFKTADSNVSLEGSAVKISKNQITGGFICTQYGHTPCTHWEMVNGASCTADGELRLQCAVCGTTLEDEIIRAYGHHFTSWGECSTCGISIEDYEEQLANAENASLVGTFFGGSPLTIVIIAVGALLIIMAVYLIIKRRKKQ